MNSNLINTGDYKAFIQDVKQRIQASQIKAATSVNRELLLLYWDLAERIVARQQASNWGDNFLEQLSRDLKTEFPEMKGFSKRNLEVMRQWYQFWSDKNLFSKQIASPPDQSAIAQQLAAQFKQAEIGQQLVAPIFQIPWWHNVVIISKIKNPAEAAFYIHKTIQNNWSRAVLTHQIESGLYQREGKAVTNFQAALPAPHSDLNFGDARLYWAFRRRARKQIYILPAMRFRHDSWKIT